MMQRVLEFSMPILRGTIVTAFLFLAGCTLFGSTTPQYGIPLSPEACKVLKSQTLLIKQITNAGVLLEQVGDEVVIYLPADKFFYSQSNDLLQRHFLVLQRIVALINTYPITDIQVIGYTDCTCDPLRNLALSRAQAQAIANYLWVHGLNARLVSAQGQGNATPIANNYTAIGQSMNRRVEISFRMPPPDNVFH